MGDELAAPLLLPLDRLSRRGHTKGVVARGRDEKGRELTTALLLLQLEIQSTHQLGSCKEGSSTRPASP